MLKLLSAVFMFYNCAVEQANLDLRRYINALLLCINRLPFLLPGYLDLLALEYVQYNTIQYNTIQYNTIQYNTIHINSNNICKYTTKLYNNRFKTCSTDR